MPHRCRRKGALRLTSPMRKSNTEVQCGWCCTSWVFVDGAAQVRCRWCGVALCACPRTYCGLLCELRPPGTQACLGSGRPPHPPVQGPARVRSPRRQERNANCALPRPACDRPRAAHAARLLWRLVLPTPWTLLHPATFCCTVVLLALPCPSPAGHIFRRDVMPPLQPPPRLRTNAVPSANTSPPERRSDRDLPDSRLCSTSSP